MSGSISATASGGVDDCHASAALAPAPADIGRRGLLAVAALVALADWLLFDRASGIALALFALLLAGGAVALNHIRASRTAVVLGAVALVAGVLPQVVNPSALALLFLVLGVALFAVLLFANAGPGLGEVHAATRSLLLSCLRRAPLDMRHALVSAAGNRPRSPLSTLVVWFMPVTLGLVFSFWLAAANPVIESWLKAIDVAALIRQLADHIDGPRIAFWLVVTLLIWPVLFVREYRRHRTARAEAKHPGSEAGIAGWDIVGQAAILRSLIVFNVIFAAQTVLDALYLWGGVALPDGMTYAEYAHRGAHPLILTALLAAAFVVIALRPGSRSERVPIIRALVCIWIAQNVWLVVSSILRLDLYVAAYSLTYMRVAAFVWMLLVAVGLVLIMARIVLGRSSQWLIGANLVSLGLVLYASAFPNFARVIADYNVARSAEMGGGGPVLDRNYLRSLGYHALPAIDSLLARSSPAADPSADPLLAWRTEKATALRRKLEDWRAWSYRDWRLLRHVEATEAVPPAQ